MAEVERFSVRAHVGAGPWHWEVRDTDKKEAVGLFVDRRAADLSADELNAKGSSKAAS